MQSSALLVRPKALLGILITTLGILSFQAICNIFLAANAPPTTNCSNLSQATSQIIGGGDSTHEISIQHDTILAAISELSNSLLHMNTSLTSLHTKLAQSMNFINDLELEGKLRGAQKCPSASPSYNMSAQESVIVCSVLPAASFFFGIVIFLEDAAHVSKSFATRCSLVITGMANVGLAFAVFGAGFLTWEKYIYRTAWPVALSMAGLALYGGSYQRTRILAEGVKVM